MTVKQKLDTIQEILLTMVAIIVVRIILLFALDFTSLADYICRPYTDQYYDKYVYAEGRINEYVLDETSKLITQGNVPQSLIYYFYDMGGMVYVTDKDLSTLCHDETEKDRENVLGFFRYGKGEYCIYLSNKLANTNSAIEHEFGHYLDYLFGWYSTKDNFEKIFDEEKESFQKNISNNEHYKTQKEYFAECYSLYVMEKETLQRYCPKTYAEMEILTEQLEIFYNMENFSR